MKKDFGIKVAKVLAWSALGFAVASHLWAANRGLEMTDEASYFLIALDPWKTWGHGTFHGFLLRPLYLLGGESVAGLRWIGYAVLLVAAWRLASAIRLRLGSEAGAAGILAAPILMVASMTCYSAGMRSPCYNWMILVGALLLWSGWLRCGIGRLGPIEMGLGLTMAVVGKWGAALILLLLFVALSLKNRNISLGPKPREWQTALLTFAVTVSGFALYAGWHGIWDTLQAGLLIAKTTGSHGWFIVPKYGWEIFYYFYRIGRAFVWLLPPILWFWWLAKKNPEKWSIQKIATILFAVGLSLAAVRGWWRGGIEQFGKESVLAGCWFLGVAWTVWAANRRTEGRVSSAKDIRSWSGVGVPPAVFLALVLTPFLCGIGTNTSIADYAGQGTVFFAAAGVLMFRLMPAPGAGSVALVAVTGLCLMQAARVSSSLLGMYRVGSVLQQTETLNEGPEAGRLRTDLGTRSELESIGRILRQSGFQLGSPVVGVDSLCGWVYLSGAKSPGVPWFFRDKPEYLKQVLARLDTETLHSSWIWLRSSSVLADSAGWWPQARIPYPRQVAGQTPLNTDRGCETLSIFAPQR